MKEEFPKINPEEIELQKHIKKIDDFVDSLPKNATLSLTDPFASFWTHYAIENENPKMTKFLRDKLENKTLVDLGYGANNIHLNAIKNLNIKKYIGVEKNLSKIYGADERVRSLTEFFKKSDIKSEIHEQDMLKFVARLPENSANFLINGIDSSIIGNEEYWKYLVREIHRATETNGIITGVNTEVNNFTREGLFKTVLKEFDDDFYVLEKEN